MKNSIFLIGLIVTYLHAEDFRLNYLGSIPITLHTNLSYVGEGEKGAHLVAVSRNESGKIIQHAKICIVATGWQQACLFNVWNEGPWLPGTELHWDLKTNRSVRGGLAHTASIIEFATTPDAITPPPASAPITTPTAAITGPPKPLPLGPQLPTSPKIAKLPNLQIGTVLDSQSAKTYMTAGVTAQANTTGTAAGLYSGTASGGIANGSYFGTENSHTNAAAQIHNMSVNEKQLVIVTPDFIYCVNDAVEKSVGFDLYGSLGRVISNHKHGCHVIVNDPVQFSQDKGYLNVVDVDGKICRMEIDKQERILPAPKGP